MKNTVKKVLALILSLVLIAVPLSTVLAETADEPAPETDPDAAAVQELLDQFAYGMSLIENSSLPDYVKEILLQAIGAYNEYAEGLVHEDGTPMTDEEALEYMIDQMVSMIVSLVKMAVEVISMFSSIAGVAPEADVEA